MSKTLSSLVIRGTHLIALLMVTTCLAQAKGVVKGRYIVTFEPKVSDVAAAGRQLSQLHGFKVRNVYRNALHGMVIEVSPVAGTAVMNALRRNPLVRSVVQDRQVTLSAQTDPKGVRRVDAELGIGIRANPGTGIDVAVMDSGIDSTHRDLAVDTARNATCIDGNPCTTGPGTGEDGFGHGTSVAGAIAALDNNVDIVGVAPGANLISVQVFDSNGQSSNSDIIAGIDYLLTLNQTNLVEVVNMSFRDICTDSSGFFAAPCAGNPDFQPLETALQNLANSGTTIVTAAGNDAIDTQYVMPASSNAVIAVSAMADSNGKPGGGGAKVCVSRLGNFCLQTTPDDSFAPFSNFGSPVAVTAPGTDELLLAMGGGTTKASGTSFSAPYAAGVAAIFIRDRLNRGEATPSPGKVKKALIQTGECYQSGSSAGYLFYGTTGCPSVWPGDSDGIAEPIVRADNIANYIAPTPVHDVAVTSVQPPSAPIPINSSKTVVVSVTNQGTEPETFTVRLTDSLASTISAAKSVTLNDGASASLTFNWAPTARGNHVLTATADTVPNETDTADNVKSVVVMVTDVVVTEVDAPVSVVWGNTVNVAVTVQNLANVSQSVSVSITDTPPSGSTAGSVSCPGALSLAAGTSTIFNCSWNTTGAGVGMHTLTVTASDGVASDSVTTTPTVFIPGAATFVSNDNKTQGTWKGVYGAQGFAIANDVINYPSYAQVTFSNQLSATWASSTTDVRALQKGAPTATDRIASTWVQNSSFNININLIDGNWHRVGFYCLDWDNRGRSERIDVFDQNTNTLLDTRSVSAFTNGVYLVWNLKGGVRIQVTLLGGDNAVVSGLFFDQPAVGDFSISASPSSQTVFQGTSTTYNVTVTPALGFNGSVTFSATGLPTGASASFNPASVVGSGSTTMTVSTALTTPAGSSSITIVGTSGSLTHSTPTPVGLLVTIPVTVGANFYKTDTQTQGTWKGVYGADGFAIANDLINYPSYAQVTFNNAILATWAGSTTDVRALQKGAPTATDRIASTWVQSSSFSININLIDGNWHQVGFYCLDWDNRGRSERIDILDAATSSVLDSRSISAFTNGQYLIWNLRGNIKVQVTLLAGDNAVVSGLFFNQPAPPDFSISASPGSRTVGQGASTTYNVTVASTPGFIGTVTFSATGLPTGATASFSPASVVGSGSSTMTVTTGLTTPAGNSSISISGTSGGLTHSTPVSLLVTSGGASFYKTDTQTQGTWKGVYGADGFAIANDVTNYPSYAQVTFNNQLLATWASSTPDVRALQKGAPTATDRIASTWVQSTNFSININLVDGNWHQVGFYCLDWDFRNRAERIDILDAATNNVLDSRNVSGFANGQYLIWNLRGNVKVQVTLLGGDNAVVSGLFFDQHSPPDFSISTSPTSQSVAQGASTTYNVTVAPTLGFNGTVTLSATGLPTGAGVSFNPASVVGSGSSTMTVTTGLITPAGNSSISIAGTSGGLTHSTPVSLFVTIPVAAGASFFKTDTQTQGTWKGIYGADGFAIANDVTNYPGYAQVTFDNQLLATWAGSTTDVRALQKGAPTATDRIASTWVQSTSFTININIVDGNWHQVGFYCLDWDFRNRSERIDILDAATNSVLDSRSVSAFTNGQYVIWNLRGNVKVQVTLLGGDNAVVSGLFFN